jgi:malate dehydrogenase (oxaloacetate-decarboxylating)
MFIAAARVLSEFAPVLFDPEAPLYPPLEQVREVSLKVAVAVAREAQRSGLAEVDLDNLEQTITGKMWTPDYVPLRRP